MTHQLQPYKANLQKKQDHVHCDGKVTHKIQQRPLAKGTKITHTHFFVPFYKEPYFITQTSIHQVKLTAADEISLDLDIARQIMDI
jgi:hypothetical protein